ncbi:hypothetical protein N5938_27750 [Pseudomonas aeruginosa]|uniref:hypothetical protein n=1 Tax=Pseudomonas aeruginosa TaxID=287 RepID=UPI0021F1E24B|nr:hypothetical protein [Pseudomonas aeruginosa]UYM60264.1 hypothetical protein N5938_27750 [Pseudomonas aeruginosa]
MAQLFEGSDIEEALDDFGLRPLSIKKKAGPVSRHHNRQRKEFKVLPLLAEKDKALLLIIKTFLPYPT